MKKNILYQCIKWSLNHNTPLKHSQFNYYIHHTFIIQENKIVEWGQNKAGNAPFFYKPYQKIHSEYIAYKKAHGLLKRNKPFDIVNIRLNKMGVLKLSKPCICCFNFLKSMKCRNVYFSSGFKNEFKKLSL